MLTGRTFFFVTALAAATAQASSGPGRQPGETVATVTSLSGRSLDGAQKAGVVYDAAAAALRLRHAAGAFRAVAGGPDGVAAGCAADFDEDGWPDVVGTDRARGTIQVYQNRTSESPAADVRQPRFVTPSVTVNPAYVVEPTSRFSGAASFLCGDFDGDGHQDFLVVRCESGASCAAAGRADVFLGKGNGSFKAPYRAVADLAVLGALPGGGTRYALVDANGDGKKDLYAAVGDRVVVFLNDGQSPPRFTTPFALLDGVGTVTALAVGDFTNDGVTDVGVGAVGQPFRVFPGLLGGGIARAPQTVSGSAAGATAAFAVDVSLHGRPDLVVAGAFFANDGTTTPFKAPPQPVGASAAVALDYDQDADHTVDFLSFANTVVANRVTQAFVDCGTATAEAVDVGSAAITDARLLPTPSDAGVTWEASNDGGRSWQPAETCADDTRRLCASFSAVGPRLRWRATMCSSADRTQSPAIRSVATSVSALLATEPFRGGPIADGGIVYAGGARAGDSGHVFAMSNTTGEVLWDAADLLDATPASLRHVFTAAADGSPLELGAGADDRVRDALFAADAAGASRLVGWATSPRFGGHVLGAVESSTPALLTPPRRPYFYASPATSAYDRALLDAFDRTFAGRQELVFIGAKDGMLHAFDAKSGREVWAFVPRDVARRWLSDETAGGVTAFPDGSPTLADAKIYANWRTVLLMPEANGGRSITALDVTDTVPGGTVVGPTPLWQFSDPSMGGTFSKPVVIRTRVAGRETWMAVFASGRGAAGQGGSVYGLELATGALLWKFDVGDPSAFISSDITASGGDTVERLYVADSKGRVWKLDPSAAVDGVLSAQPIFTAGGAVLGVIAAAEDSAGRVVLTFGTSSKLYAVHADDGSVRSQADVAGYTGGAVVQSGQIVYSAGADLVAVDAVGFVQQLVDRAASRIVPPLFTDAGQVYAVTIGGQLVVTGGVIQNKYPAAM